MTRDGLRLLESCLRGRPALVRRHHERSATVTEHTLTTGRTSADRAALSPFVPALALTPARPTGADDVTAERVSTVG